MGNSYRPEALSLTQKLALPQQSKARSTSTDLITTFRTEEECLGWRCVSLRKYSGFARGACTRATYQRDSAQYFSLADHPLVDCVTLMENLGSEKDETYQSGRTLGKVERHLMSTKTCRIGFLPLVLFVACSESNLEVGDIYTGSGYDSGAGPQPLPSFETGVDQGSLAEIVLPQLVKFVQGTQPGANTASIRLGRPWGQFDLHKGPRLVFRSSWRMLASMDEAFFAVVNVISESGSYMMTGVGSVGFIPTMVQREGIPAVSAALDRGQAGMIRCTGEGGDSLLGYVTDGPTDAGQGEIRVQPLFGDQRFAGIAAGPSGQPEMSLSEMDLLLPVE